MGDPRVSPVSAGDALRDPAVRPCDDVPAAFSAALAEAFAARTRERFVLVLSGGPTARACYEAVASSATGIDWQLVDVYVGDERMVPPDDPEANQRLIRESLLEPVGGVGSFTPMPTEEEPDECAALYEAAVAGVIDRGGFDFIHLGMGPDGHTASLFPGADSLNAGPTTFAVGTEDPNGVIPLARLTLTLPAIAAARLAVFTVAGAAKHDAVSAVRAGVDLPAARVRADAVRWLIDAEAFGDDEPGSSAR
jgi:6-phosphogluconolactonase